MVGIVLISHSQKAAEGAVELARMMAPDAPIAAAGGLEDGSLGTSFEKITAAVEAVDQGDGVACIMDMGSAVMTAEMVAESLAVILGGIGAYIGNMAYEEFYDAPWDQLLGIENHSRDVSTVRQWEKERGWEPVRVNGQDGTILRGTYIENRHDSHKTVILIHGLYQNRSMCLPYMEVYRRLGYNILLIDLRGHGESEGAHTEWGIREIDDLAMWCQWLRNRDEQMSIGLHGVSLGAAMALLYAGSEYGKDLSFVVADSSYGNIISLGREKLWQASGDKRAIWSYDLLDPFFQAAMFYHTHKTVSSLEPAQAVKRMKMPVLFLHGSDDALVPVKTAKSLYDNCTSPKKELYIFADSPHAVGIETDRSEYLRVVSRFIEKDVLND